MAICLEYQTVYEEESSFRSHIFSAVLLFLALCFKVWVRTESIDVGYDLAQERNKTIELDTESRELNLQLSVLLRSDELMSNAKTRLNLQPISPSQMLKLTY